MSDDDPGPDDRTTEIDDVDSTAPRERIRRVDHTLQIGAMTMIAAIAVPCLTSGLGYCATAHNATLAREAAAAALVKTEAIKSDVATVKRTTDSTLVRVDGRLTQALEQIADFWEAYAVEHPGDVKAQERARNARKAARTPLDARTATQIRAGDDGTSPVMPLEVRAPKTATAAPR